DFVEIPEDSDYPFILITGIQAHHSGKLTSYSENLCLIIAEGFCQISPSDADKFGLKTGEEVWVESPKGKIKMKLKIDDSLNPGTVFIPLYFKEIKLNLLLDKDKSIDRVKLAKIG
ncbi:MAG: hypothetical protein MUO78_01310, partial [candidate division Zixibacteria bacterium]|nr:hypothetical protein [candidate division Zixibacteria bacterium]